MGSFTGKLVTAGVEISMDGRGRFMDNIFIERLWRSIKYEEVHLKAYADGREARVRRDNQDENRPTIRMRIRRRGDIEGRA